MRDIETKFGFARLQDTFTIMKEIQEKGFGIEILDEYLKMRREELNNATEGTIIIRHCPKCNRPLGLSQVNTSDRTQTDDNSKTVWFCRECHWEDFSTLTIQEQIEKYGD